MIKVSWSPQFCLLSRKTNINDIKNTKLPLNDRLVTFEGPEYCSESGFFFIFCSLIIINRFYIITDTICRY